jgi:hypothetical protein
MAEDDQSTSGAGDGREADEQQTTPSTGRRPWSGWTMVQQAALPLAGLAVGIAVVAAVVGPNGPAGDSGAPSPQVADASEICSEALDDVRRIPRRAADRGPGVNETVAVVSAAATLLEGHEPRLAAALEAEVAALEDSAAAREALDAPGYLRARARLRRAGRRTQAAARAANAPECARLARVLRRPIR